MSQNNSQGVFIKEHAIALSPYFDVHVVYLNITKSSEQLFWTREVDHDEQEGLYLHIIKIKSGIRRFGIHDYLVKSSYQATLQGLQSKYRFAGYCLNVRTEITKHIPSVPCLKNLPFVLIEHFGLYGRLVQDNSEKARNKRREIQQWLGHPQLIKVLTVSNDMSRTLIEHYGVPASKIHKIENVASSIFRFRGDINASKRLEIVAAATWEFPKRPDLMLAAFLHSTLPELNNAVLHIFGGGQLIEEAKKQMVPTPDGKQVVFHGYKNKSEIALKLLSASLLIHPSDAENAPTIIAEALCSGTPVLSMNINGIPEMISEENGVLVDPNNADNLKVGLDQIVGTLASYDRKKIADAAFNKYSAEKVGLKLSQHLKEITIES